MFCCRADACGADCRLADSPSTHYRHVDVTICVQTWLTSQKYPVVLLTQPLGVLQWQGVCVLAGYNTATHFARKATTPCTVLGAVRFAQFAIMWRFMALQWPTAATFRRAATDNLPQLPSWAAAVRAPAAASQPLLGWHSSSSLTLVPPRQRLTAFTKYFLGFSAVALASSQTQEGQLIERARLAWLIPTRLARDVYAAATIVAGAGISVLVG